MTDLIKIDAVKAGNQLSEAVSAARQLVESASSDIVRDLVQVQAQMMIESALTDDVRALILAAGRAGHYEVIPAGKGGTVPDGQIVAVCVQAYTRGLSLSGQEFAVFPKRGGGAALYIKSNGYRHLFARSGHASDVSVSIGYPDVKPLEVAGKTKDSSHETGGKAVALMAGKVSVVWDGKPVSVEASGEYRVGIPCYVTDNIDGLQAKAERRLLARLWAKCTGIREADPETTDEVEPVIVTDVDYSQVEAGEPMPASDPGPPERDWAAEKERFVAEYQRITEDPLKTLYLSVMRAPDVNAVSSVMEAAATVRLSAKERSSLNLARDWQLERIAAGVV